MELKNIKEPWKKILQRRRLRNKWLLVFSVICLFAALIMFLLALFSRNLSAIITLLTVAAIFTLVCIFVGTVILVLEVFERELITKSKNIIGIACVGLVQLVITVVISLHGHPFTGAILLAGSAGVLVSAIILQYDSYRAKKILRGMKTTEEEVEI